MSAGSKLTRQQKKFCRLVATGTKPSIAIVKAGLTKTTNRHSASTLAGKLLKNVEIDEYKKYLEGQLNEADKIADQKIMEGAKSPAVTWDVAAFYAEQGQNPDNLMRDRIHCADSYAKLMGLFVNKTEVSGDLVIDVVIDDGEG